MPDPFANEPNPPVDLKNPTQHNMIPEPVQPGGPQLVYIVPEDSSFNFVLGNGNYIITPDQLNGMNEMQLRVLQLYLRMAIRSVNAALSTYRHIDTINFDGQPL